MHQKVAVQLLVGERTGGNQSIFLSHTDVSLSHWNSRRSKDTVKGKTFWWMKGEKKRLET